MTAGTGAPVSTADRLQRSVIGVVLLTVNQRQKTLRCIRSFQPLDADFCRIVLWDNGSTDDTPDAVRVEFPDVLVHHAPQNVGVASGRNGGADLAISAFDPKFLLFVDNDMTVSPGFMHLLLAPFENDDQVAQTTGKIAWLTDDGDDDPRQRVIYGAGGCRVRFWLGDTSHIGYGEVDHGQYDKLGPCVVSGGCMMVRTSVFKALGGFDSIYDPYGPEDLDFGLRARKSGYSAQYVPEALVFHDPQPGRSFEGGHYTETYAAQRMRTWMVFMARHATVIEKIGFFLVGGPYRLVRLIGRECRRGNLQAIKGLVQGATRRIKT